MLLYKRLESGSFQWPRTGEEARQLTAQQYRWLMEGLECDLDMFMPWLPTIHAACACPVSSKSSGDL